MSSSTRSAVKYVLEGVAYGLFGIGGLSFWVGGQAISEFGKIDRLFAEMAGLALAGGCGILGFMVRTLGERIEEGEEDRTSILPVDEELRK